MANSTGLNQRILKIQFQIASFGEINIKDLTIEFAIGILMEKPMHLCLFPLAEDIDPEKFYMELIEFLYDYIDEDRLIE